MLRPTSKPLYVATIAGLALTTSFQVNAQGTAQPTTSPAFQLGAQANVNLNKDMAVAGEDRDHDQFVAGLDQQEDLENVNNKKRLEELDKNLPDPDYREVAKKAQERAHQNNLVDLKRRRALEDERHAKRLAEIAAQFLNGAVNGAGTPGQASANPGTNNPNVLRPLGPAQLDPRGAPLQGGVSTNVTPGQASATPNAPSNPVLKPLGPAKFDPRGAPLQGEVSKTVTPSQPASPKLTSQTPTPATTGPSRPLPGRAVQDKIPGSATGQPFDPKNPQMGQSFPKNLPPTAIPPGYYLVKGPNGDPVLVPNECVYPDSTSDLLIAGTAATVAKGIATVCGSAVNKVVDVGVGAPKPIPDAIPPEEEMVWVNRDSRIIWRQGTRYAGNTKNGEWMTLKDAGAKGYNLPKPDPTGAGYAR